VSPGARAAMLLAIGSFVLYNANVREISSQDTIPNRALPHEALVRGRLDLDPLFQTWPASDPLPFWIQRVGSHYVSSYPIAPALLAVPVYVGPVLLGADGSWFWLNVLSKLAASGFAALSVALVYLAARELARRLGTGEGSAVATAAVYAVAAPTWAVSSQGLWGHAPAQLCVAAALWAVAGPRAGPVLLGLAGATSALAVACRPTAVLLAAAITLQVVWARRAGAWPFLALAAAVSLGVVGYNVATFGTLQGGYTELHQTHPQWHGVAAAWSVSGVPGRLAGLLVSPSRGLLVYSPVLVAALAGLWTSMRAARDALLRSLALGVGGTFLMLGVYGVWWGGHSFGPRLFVDVLPALVLGIVPVWPSIQRSRARQWLFGVAVAVSVLVEAVGAFYYPSPRGVDWNTSPNDVDFAHERLWDWHDTQLLRLLRNGPAGGGFRTTP
jgi:hypothetical protein